jgi:hypothetical protein
MCYEAASLEQIWHQLKQKRKRDTRVTYVYSMGNYIYICSLVYCLSKDTAVLANVLKGNKEPAKRFSTLTFSRADNVSLTYT